MNQELTRITGAVQADPKLAYDKNYISMYQKAGGTLSNNAIPMPTSTSLEQNQAKVMNQNQGDTIQPTTISGDKTQQINNINKKIIDINNGYNQNKIEQKNALMNGGFQYYNDGVTPMSAPLDSIQQTDQDGHSWWVSGGKNYAIGPDTTLSSEQQQKKDIIDKLQKDSDVYFSGALDAIRKSYDSLIAQQKQINASQEGGLRQSMFMGGAQYTQAGEGQIAAQMSFGLQKISDLTAKELSAISDLNKAQLDHNYDIASKKMAEIDKIREDKQKTAKDLNDKIVATNKDLRTQLQTTNNAIDNDIRTAILDAQKGGATLEQLTEMKKALDNHDFTSAIEVGGDSLRTASGWMGDYFNYKKDAISRGIIPMTPVEYRNWDDNNKARVAAAGATIARDTDMTYKQQTVFNQIVNQRNKSPLIMANDRAKILIDITNAVSADPSNAALQVSFIYGMIQALDTYQSAVREGEINLIQGTQGLKEKIENLPSKIEKGNPLNPSKIDEYVKVSKKITDSIANATSQKNNVFKAQAISNGIGKQWDEFEKTTEVLNKTSPINEQVISEEESEKQVTDYVSKNPEVVDKVEQMIKDGVPYGKIKKSFNLQ